MKLIKEFYNDDIGKQLSFRASHRIKCSHCDTRIFFNRNKEKFICPKCGYYIYRDKKLEFKETLRKVLG